MTGPVFVDLAAVNEVPEGIVKTLTLNDIRIGICRLGNEFIAFESVCTHEDCAFEDGPITDEEIECPRHGARFNVRSGRATRLPAIRPLKTFPTRVESDRIMIHIEED